MAPLSNRSRLKPCRNCGLAIKRSDATCRHCGAVLDARGLAIAPSLLPVVLGLALAGCADDGAPAETEGATGGGDDGSAGDDAASMTGMSTLGMSTMGSTDDVGDDVSDDLGDSFGEEAAYGVGDSGIFDDDGTSSSGGMDDDSGGTGGSGDSGGSDTGFGSDSGSGTGFGSETGDASTSGASTGGSDSGDVGEPEYGVPMTGVEPLYGAGVSDDGPG